MRRTGTRVIEREGGGTGAGPSALGGERPPDVGKVRPPSGSSGGASTAKASEQAGNSKEKKERS